MNILIGQNGAIKANNILTTEYVFDILNEWRAHYFLDKS